VLRGQTLTTGASQRGPPLADIDSGAHVRAVDLKIEDAIGFPFHLAIFQHVVGDLVVRGDHVTISLRTATFRHTIRACKNGCARILP